MEDPNGSSFVGECMWGGGGGGEAQLLVPRWTRAGVVALLCAFLIPGCVPCRPSWLGGLVG